MKDIQSWCGICSDYTPLEKEERIDKGQTWEIARVCGICKTETRETFPKVKFIFKGKK